MRSKTFLVLGLAATIGGAGMLAAQTQGAQTQSAPEPVEKVGAGVMPPRLAYSPAPDYSEKARAAKYQGICTLGLVVGADGKPRNIRVLNSIGLGLDEKAIEAVSTWRFHPALKDGKPVAVQIAVEVDFHLLGAGRSKIEDLTKRASTGDAKAQLDLANEYLKGKADPEDEGLGLYYLEKAAKQGLTRAQFEMAEHIIQKGASADYSKAYMWYTLASRSGYKHSEKALKELAAKMTPQQLQAGQTLVDNWTNVPANSGSPRQ